MNSSLPGRASANQAFLDALDQLDETFGEESLADAIAPQPADGASERARETRGTEARAHSRPAPARNLPPKRRA